MLFFETHTRSVLDTCRDGFAKVASPLGEAELGAEPMQVS